MSQQAHTYGLADSRTLTASERLPPIPVAPWKQFKLQVRLSNPTNFTDLTVELDGQAINTETNRFTPVKGDSGSQQTLTVSGTGINQALNFECYDNYLRPRLVLTGDSIDVRAFLICKP